MSPLPWPGPTGRARRLVLVGLLLVVPAACSDDASSDGPSPTDTATATQGAAGDDDGGLPDADGTWVVLGEGSDREPVTSTCVASTTARSTVLARGEAGTEVAVTVFTTDPGPTVEVDLVTTDGRRLVAERVEDVDWEFVGSTIVGETTVSDRAGDDEAVAFSVDFSSGLPECDNQRRLGPGGGESADDAGDAGDDATTAPGDGESETPDVVTT